MMVEAGATELTGFAMDIGRVRPVLRTVDVFKGQKRPIDWKIIPR
jgi:hypothetical protein